MVKYNRILFISDNPDLLRRVERDILLSFKDNLNYTFGCSPFSNVLSFSDLGVKCSPLDLRKDEVLQTIILNFDLVFSIHCKQLFPEKLVSNIKCINIHPGYNPINRGWYPQVFAIINQTKIGATIHEIDNYLDNGDIIDRAEVNQYSSDTSLTLYNRILEMELLLLKRNFENIITKTYETIKPEGKGNLYSKKDFNNLLELDMKEQVTMKEAIDKLRALTHGDYNNAYFKDPVTGKKIYVRISLQQE